jgi:glycosyltransferase involved in cell wall biosynthesis
MYSICITNYNTEDSVRQSLESILAQVDERFEIVVVDNCSKDASIDILREYEGKHIKLIVERCSRGLGRQLAIKSSSGKYIISQMDMDDVFKPNLNKLLRIYHADFEGYMLVLPEIIMIAPRGLIDAIGGFRDLDYLEERDLYTRAARLGYLKYLRPSFKIKEREIKKKKLHLRIKRMFEQQYLMFREYFRLGEGTRSCYHAFIKTTNIRKRPFVFLTRILVIPWAFVTHWFYPQFHSEFVNFFNDLDVITDRIST